MKLKMSGHDKTRTQYVSAEQLKRVSGGNSKGYFFSDIEWDDAVDPIVVKIKNIIYVNKTLKGQTKKDVEAHEKKHFADFKKLATKMKKDIEQALKDGKDPQMADRMEWLLYDRCRTSAAFHRDTAGYSVEICLKPSSTRPT